MRTGEKTVKGHENCLVNSVVAHALFFWWGNSTTKCKIKLPNSTPYILISSNTGVRYSNISETDIITKKF
jgi:hypothetical protein